MRFRSTVLEFSQTERLLLASSTSFSCFRNVAFLIFSIMKHSEILERSWRQLEEKLPASNAVATSASCCCHCFYISSIIFEVRSEVHHLSISRSDQNSAEVEVVLHMMHLGASFISKSLSRPLTRHRLTQLLALAPRMSDDLNLVSSPSSSIPFTLMSAFAIAISYADRYIKLTAS
jgi:hypothetical protein